MRLTAVLLHVMMRIIFLPVFILGFLWQQITTEFMAGQSANDDFYFWITGDAE